jgi:hypothetical protein
LPILCLRGLAAVDDIAHKIGNLRFFIADLSGFNLSYSAIKSIKRA